MDPQQTLSTNGAVSGEFVLLELTYVEGMVPIRKVIVSDEIRTGSQPSIAQSWFSLIDMKPKGPLVEVPKRA